MRKWDKEQAGRVGSSRNIGKMSPFLKVEFIFITIFESKNILYGRVASLFVRLSGVV